MSGRRDEWECGKIRKNEKERGRRSERVHICVIHFHNEKHNRCCKGIYGVLFNMLIGYIFFTSND